MLLGDAGANDRNEKPIPYELNNNKQGHMENQLLHALEIKEVTEVVFFFLPADYRIFPQGIVVCK